MAYSDDKPRVLLVAEQEDHSVLIRRALDEAGPAGELVEAADARSALRILREEGRRPTLLLLGQALPRADAQAVLRELKTAPELRSIPVIVLTGSGHDDDVREAYDLHANCYLAKPPESGEFLAVLRRTLRFWLGTVRLPLSGSR